MENYRTTFRKFREMLEGKAETIESATPLGFAPDIDAIAEKEHELAMSEQRSEEGYDPNPNAQANINWEAR